MIVEDPAWKRPLVLRMDENRVTQELDQSRRGRELRLSQKPDFPPPKELLRVPPRNEGTALCPYVALGEVPGLTIASFDQATHRAISIAEFDPAGTVYSNSIDAGNV